MVCWARASSIAASDDIGNFALMTCQHAISLGRHAGNQGGSQGVEDPDQHDVDLPARG
jgi:hypothetical protein